MSDNKQHIQETDAAKPQYDLNGSSLAATLIRRPTLVVVLFVVLGLLGMFAYTTLSYELIPKVNPPVITIATVYPGASPQEVETSVTKEIEEAISTLENIDNVRATSSEGLSLIVVNFTFSANIDQSLQDAQRLVNAARAELPDDVKESTINKFALDELPILNVAVTAQMDPKSFFDLMEDQVKPRLAKLNGVGQVTIAGGDEREILVNVDEDKLRTYGLSIAQVSAAISSFNVDVPTGNVKDTDGQYNVRIAGKFGSLDQLSSLIIGQSQNGGSIRLETVAEVEDGVQDRTNIVRLNGKNAVGLFVQKQTDANAVAVSELARAEFDKMAKDYANTGLKFEIANDTSEFTVAAADAVEHDLLLAIILVAVVMLIFLHSLRDSFIVLVAIPASIISVFTVFYIMDFTLNLMTMLALSLVVGILVDDSIVVLENIHRHLEMGKDRRQAALDGRMEIGFTALSITLVDVVVFLPLSFVDGIVGGIIRSYALVVVFSTLLSLLVSFTITPVLASRMSKLEHFTGRTPIGKFVLGFEGWFNRLRHSYGDAVGWAVGRGWRRWAITIGSLLLFFVGSGFLLGGGFIGGEFIERSDRGEFSLIVELPLEAKIEQTSKSVYQIEKTLSDTSRFPEINRIFTNVGASNEGLIGQSAPNSAELRVNLVPFEERKRTTEEVTDQIRQVLLAEHPDVKARVTPIGFFGSADEAPIQLFLASPNYDSLLVASKKMLAFVKDVDGTKDTRLSTEDGKPEIRVELDRDKMVELGVNIVEVGGALRTALTGNDDSKYRDGIKDYTIRVQLDKFDRTRTDDIGKLSFRNNRGELIELQQFSTIYQDAGPSKLERYNRSSSILLTSQIVGVPAGNVSGAIQAKLDEPGSLPNGVTYAWEGDVKNQAEGFGSLGLALLIAIVFMYLIMVALYNSYVYPFVVLFSLPVAIIGALLALAMTMKSLTIFSILGIIMLMGLVAKNAILLVDFANKRREEGIPLKEAIAEAGRERLRPIVMTTFAMIFGMMPIAVASGAGSEWKNGLAWALIGGLTSSMFLTLFVVPAAYVQTTNVVAFFGRLFSGKPKPTDTDGPADGNVDSILTNPYTNGHSKDEPALKPEFTV